VYAYPTSMYKIKLSVMNSKWINKESIQQPHVDVNAEALDTFPLIYGFSSLIFKLAKKEYFYILYDVPEFKSNSPALKVLSAQK
jgi:hypothetical protein